jgi:hypothetical protein
VVHPDGGAGAAAETALAAIDATRFVPPRGRTRLRSMVEARPDWCVSRQRAWGVPIAVFVDKATGEVLRDADVVERVARAFEEEGADAWWTRDPQEFLGDAYAAADYDKVDDILDVWFESGCTHAFVLERRPDLKWPADLYLEGSDQHRGWFQSSLLESSGTRGRAPFGTVLTHGFVMDAQGRKMSKSLGNTVSPADLLKTHGADILRLWVVSADYTEDLRIGKEILDGVGDSYRRLRNTLRYLLGNLDGFTDASGCRTRDAGAGAVGAAPPGRAGRVGSRVQRELRLPEALRRAAQLLRHRPLRLLLRRPQGQPLLRPGRGDDAAGGADGARRAVRLPDGLAGPGPRLHGRGGVAHPVPVRDRQRPPATFPESRPTGATTRWPRAGSGCGRCVEW